MTAALSAPLRFYLGLLALNVLALGVAFHALRSMVPYGDLSGWVLATSIALACAPAWLWFRAARAVASLTRARPFRMPISLLPCDEGAAYIGHGFEWQSRDSERLLRISASGVAPALATSNRYGGNWVVHGIGMDREKDLRMPEDLLNQHALILGTTGVGKTRMLEVLIAQAIRRGDAVIVIDPKGDERLLERVVETCRDTARLSAFRLFALPYPSRSVRYNPLCHFVQVRELADRIAALLPAGGDSEPFRAFCWEVVNTVCQAMHACGEAITPYKVKRYSIEDTWELVRIYVTRKYPTLPLVRDGRALAEVYRKCRASGSIEGQDALDFLISLASKDRENYGKMTNTLVPILSKLSTGPNKALMSDFSSAPPPAERPDDGFPDMPREQLTWRGVDKARQVVYFYLGSMLGFDTAAAVAKMALLDFQSFIGAKYAYERVSDFGSISLFVDELADVVTPEFIGVLNKSRGADVRITMCGQTSADLEAALRSRAYAAQVVGNANTVIQFRAQNTQDAEIFSRLSGERPMRSVAESSHYEPGLFKSGKTDVDEFRASFGHSLSWRNEPLVPAWAVTELPRFHYFARWGARVFKGRVPLLDDPRTDYVRRIKTI